NATAAVSLPNAFTLSNTTLIGGLTIGGTGALTFLGAGTLAGSNTLTQNDTGGVVFNGPIGESGAGASLTIAGAQPVALNNANTYSGGTTITGTNALTL